MKSKGKKHRFQLGSRSIAQFFNSAWKWNLRLQIRKHLSCRVNLKSLEGYSKSIYMSSKRAKTRSVLTSRSTRYNPYFGFSEIPMRPPPPPNIGCLPMKFNDAAQVSVVGSFVPTRGKTGMTNKERSDTRAGYWLFLLEFTSETPPGKNKDNNKTWQTLCFVKSFNFTLFSFFLPYMRHSAVTFRCEVKLILHELTIFSSNI